MKPTLQEEKDGCAHGECVCWRGWGSLGKLELAGDPVNCTWHHQKGNRRKGARFMLFILQQGLRFL